MRRRKRKIKKTCRIMIRIRKEKTLQKKELYIIIGIIIGMIISIINCKCRITSGKSGEHITEKWRITENCSCCSCCSCYCYNCCYCRPLRRKCPKRQRLAMQHEAESDRQHGVFDPESVPNAAAMRRQPQSWHAPARARPGDERAGHASVCTRYNYI